MYIFCILYRRVHENDLVDYTFVEPHSCNDDLYDGTAVIVYYNIIIKYIYPPKNYRSITASFSSNCAPAGVRGRVGPSPAIVYDE